MSEKKSRGIRLLKLFGEKLFNSLSVQQFLQKIARKLNKMVVLPRQTYNADESILFRKFELDPALMQAKEKFTKTLKEAETFIVYTNGNDMSE